ncbi:MerR family transcriptional regulator [Deinococcus aquatilis]|uniref:MerR family transcriptional regulator n=1 Tax=Deinococcus aquatilis TaxID=519440 RepID=UPI00146AC007|nr:MerR family transcriptional regulator [Deinococcus aquatilis]
MLDVVGLDGLELDVATDWTGGIEQLVHEANLRLVYLLPEDRSGRAKDEVNARLVRHYTTQGLLSAPRREGREARYTRRQLLELLALRRLMADGLGGKVLTSALEGRTQDELVVLALQGSDGLGSSGGHAAMPERLQKSLEAPPEDGEDALSFLAGIRRRSALPPALLSPAPKLESTPLMIPSLSAPAPAPQAPPLLGVAANPSLVPSPSRKPQALTRVQVRRGLELQVSGDMAWPHNPRQWDALMEDLRASLLALHKASEGTSGDDAGQGKSRERTEQDQP